MQLLLWHSLDKPLPNLKNKTRWNPLICMAAWLDAWLWLHFISCAFLQKGIIIVVWRFHFPNSIKCIAVVPSTPPIGFRTEWSIPAIEEVLASGCHILAQGFMPCIKGQRIGNPYLSVESGYDYWYDLMPQVPYIRLKRYTAEETLKVTRYVSILPPKVNLYPWSVLFYRCGDRSGH